jgi:hypothetical protein
MLFQSQEKGGPHNLLPCDLADPKAYGNSQEAGDGEGGGSPCSHGPVSSTASMLFHLL